MSADPQTRAEAPFWSHFDHASDIGIHGCGDSMAEAFEQAALALVAVICDPQQIRPLRHVCVACQNPDPEMLFLDWIDAVIYEISAGHMLFGRFRVGIDGSRLTAEMFGEPLDVARHHPAVEVKGATLTALEVRRDDTGRWHARCVVDV